MSDLRDKIVGVLNTEGAFCGTCDREPGDSLYCKTCERVLSRYADAVLAVLDLDTIRAEAQVEALREAADALAGAEPSHLGDADEGLEFFDYGTAAEYGIDVAAAYLRNVANETAREAGIETGENSDA